MQPGERATVPKAGRSVFVNCPFDGKYKPLRDAILLSALACGFTPRMANDSGDVSRSRMDRIQGTMLECAYSIHDLSRCEGGGDWNYARFNMPLELGMAMSMAHDWLALVPVTHSYGVFVSDLAGFDLKAHDETPPAVIRAVVFWLSTRREENITVDPDVVIDAFEDFENRIAEIEIKWNNELPRRWVKEAAKKALGVS
jgi:hypothetical protein